ncbi:hypothetical protein M8C21_005326 [Ambrosia artemisiifolia]|uniref:Uncharacterized protein n=1 Tax=Ambrosia artemisiifolia TaxID=4212 RepID=A0AAD5C355_AMBAR|nr:hypothetical protein M8C21_005326 [Ambrosia artemisiifolia]
MIHLHAVCQHPGKHRRIQAEYNRYKWHAHEALGMMTLHDNVFIKIKVLNKNLKLYTVKVMDVVGFCN